MEKILPMVPLLRFAQLAHSCKDFHDAYVHRLAAHVVTTSWLHNESWVPIPEDSTDVLSAESALNKSPWRGCDLTRAHSLVSDPQTAFEQRPRYGVARRAVLQRGRKTNVHLPPPWEGYSRGATYIGRLFVPPSIIPGGRCSTLDSAIRHSSFRVAGWFRCSLQNRSYRSLFHASAEVRCEVTVDRNRRTMECKHLIFRICHGTDNEIGLAKCLMLCTAMAPRIRTFLREVTRGARCHRMPKARVGLVERTVLVLPESWWPHQPDFAIGDALTSFMALIGARPSGARLADPTGYAIEGEMNAEFVVRSWRHPCVIPQS